MLLVCLLNFAFVIFFRVWYSLFCCCSFFSSFFFWCVCLSRIVQLNLSLETWITIYNSCIQRILSFILYLNNIRTFLNISLSSFLSSLQFNLHKTNDFCHSIFSFNFFFLFLVYSEIKKSARFADWHMHTVVIYFTFFRCETIYFFSLSLLHTLNLFVFILFFYSWILLPQLAAVLRPIT